MASAMHARLLQGMQGVLMTDVRVRICLMNAARLLQDQCALYCKTVARMLRNVGLQLKISQYTALRVLYDISLCLAAVLQILHNHLAATLHVNIR